MKFSVFSKFGALNSAPVFAAFCHGLDRHGISRAEHDLNADVAVIWSVVWAGRMRSNQAMFQHYRATNRPVVVLEVGLIERGVTWKIGINGTGQHSRFCQELDPARPRRLGVSLSPWRSDGRDIVIFCQREDSLQWHQQPEPHHWLDQTVKHIQSVTDRRIRVRPHPRRPAYAPAGTELMMPEKNPRSYDDYDIGHALDSAWCSINWNSGPGPISALRGVPVFTGPDSLAAPVANLDWSQIENPVRPDRESWLLDLCHTEWTLPEIEQGIMLEQLLGRIKSL